MLNCKEVSRIIGSDELEWAGFARRFGVWFYLMLCRHCRRYRDQITAIGELTRDVYKRRSSGQHTGKSGEINENQPDSDENPPRN